MNERIKKLRQESLDAIPTLSHERAKLLTEFYKRGEKVIGLGVDASNPTGATRLYERAGMHVASEFVIYEKEYRPGKEPEE